MYEKGSDTVRRYRDWGWRRLALRGAGERLVGGSGG